MNPWLGALVVVLALVVSTGGGWITTRAVLHVASRSSDAGGTTNPTRGATSHTKPGPASGAAAGSVTSPAPTAVAPGGTSAAEGSTAPTPAGQTPAAGTTVAVQESDGPEGPGALAALRGGTWIGILERLATTGALLVGEPTAIAVVVAVKGLGRYPELREYPAASERFVVGSLASLVWAAGVGFVGRWLLTR